MTINVRLNIGLTVFSYVNLAIGFIWAIPTFFLAVLTIALAGMTPLLMILEELLFLISPPLLFFAAGFVAAPQTPGSTLVKAIGSTAIVVINLIDLARVEYMRLPIVLAYKFVVNAAGAHH